MTTIEPLEFHNYAGTIVVFSKESNAGVRIELKRRLAIIGPDEARDVAHWLLAAADTIDPEEA